VSGSFNITGGAAVTCREYFDRLAALAGRRGVPSLPAPLLRMRPMPILSRRRGGTWDTSRRWDSTKAYVG